MRQRDQRSQKRKATCIHAFVADPGDIYEVKCIIRDVSENGCMIVSSQAHYLPDIIQLVPEGFNKPIRGKIAWKRKNLAGICFESACSPEVRAMIETLDNSLKGKNEENVLILGHENKPLSYIDRLKKHKPQRG